MNVNTIDSLLIACFLSISACLPLIPFLAGFHSILLVLAAVVGIFMSVVSDEGIREHRMSVMVALGFICASLYSISIGTFRGTLNSFSLNDKAFLLVSLFFPVLYRVYSTDRLYSILRTVGWLVGIKTLVMALIVIDQNFGAGISILWLDNTDVMVLRYAHLVRVFDSGIIYLPMIFFVTLDGSRPVRWLFESAAWVVVLGSGSISVIGTFFLLYSYVGIRKTLIGSVAVVSVAFSEIRPFLQEFLSTKDFSISIKADQFIWFMSINLQSLILGLGQGHRFEIGSRSGLLIENVFIYILSIYGVGVGTALIFLLLAIPPLCWFLSSNLHGVHRKRVRLLVLSNGFVILNSLSNPYMLSVGPMLLFAMLVTQTAALASNKRGSKQPYSLNIALSTYT